jgi:DNA repair protein RadC
MPPSTIDQRREKKYAEVLQAIETLDAFTAKDVQTRCVEAKSAFITSLIRQLQREGILRELANDQGPTEVYTWANGRDQFSRDAWIARQIEGDQITRCPVEERPRERLMSVGADNLKTSELLAILIRSGRKGESAVQSGQRLVNKFSERLHEIRSCSLAELKQVSSAVSEVAYCQIMAGIELGRRVSESMQVHGVRTERLTSTRAAIEYCARHFSRLVEDGCQEEFHIVTLDTKLQPISRHQITVGTLDASLVHPREVFRAAIRDAASSIVLVHNHPSGDPTPSREDRAVTDRLKRAGELIGISVIDHIVVAASGCVSLAEV